MTDTRNANSTYAAGDVLAFLAPEGTPDPGPPGTIGSPKPLNPATWLCMGWLDTNGSIFALKKALKDIMAAGSLDPIRTITTGAPKTMEVTALEGMNPLVRAVYDDVPLLSLQPAAGASTASYIMDSTPKQIRYAAVFDSFDPSTEARMRSFCPLVNCTGRGNDQQEQNDITMLQLTFTLYRALIGDQYGAVMRHLDYGDADITAFFDTTPPE
jgi:hypothetical protein